MKDTRKLVTIGVLTTLVVIFQLIASMFVRLGMFSVSLVLVPIVIGGAMYGVATGAWLGFVFGGIVLLSGDAQPFLVINPLGAILTVFVKGIACGMFAALIFKAITKINEYAAVIIAAAVCPIVNTGFFIIGTLLFFMPTVTEWAKTAGAESAIEFIIFGMIGLNFVFELIVNIVLSPVILKLLNYRKQRNA